MMPPLLGSLTMNAHIWMIFFAVAFVAIVSPGPAILLAISNSLTHGFKSVIFSSLGNVVGLFVLSSAAIFGLGAILKTSTTLFLIIKLIGAAYLIYLGVRQWRSNANLFTNINSTEKTTRTRKSLFVEGFLIAVTNPKAILFFTALFPQFINIQTEIIPQFFMMTFTFMCLSFLALTSYGLLATHAKRWLSTKYRVKWFNRTIGSLFVLIGIGLLQFRPAR